MQGFNLNEREADSRLQHLLNARLIEREVQNYGTQSIYVTTIDGNAIANTKFIPRLTRKKAEKLVGEICERAREINLSDDFIYRVEKIWVFGSYTTEAPDVGDLDLIVEDGFKTELGDYDSVYRDYIARSDRHFRNTLDAIFYPSHEVLRYLKNRSRYISLHEKDQIKLLGVKAVLLFDGTT